MDNKIMMLRWICESIKKMKEIRDTPDFIAFWVDFEDMNVHMTEKGFRKYFGKTGELVEHNCDYDQLQRVVDGVKFFTLVDRHE